MTENIRQLLRRLQDEPDATQLVIIGISPPDFPGVMPRGELYLTLGDLRRLAGEPQA